MTDPYAAFRKTTLPNGLDVHYSHWDCPWIIVHAVVHCGSREDRAKMPGISHFLEHLVSENASGWTRDGISEFFEGIGGILSIGSTNYLSSDYGFMIPAETHTLKQALDIFGSMLFGQTIEHKIEHERTVVEREYFFYYFSPQKIEWETAVHRNLFKGHRLERPSNPIGTLAGIRNISREQLEYHYETYYTPANTSLVVLGGSNEAELLELLTQSTCGISKKGKRNLIPSPFVNFQIPDKHQQRVSMGSKSPISIDVAHFESSWALASVSNRSTLPLFTQCLNQVLHDELREKRKLTYAFETHFCHYQDVEEVLIKGQIPPHATKDITELVQECVEKIPSYEKKFELKRKRHISRYSSLHDVSGKDCLSSATHDISLYQRIIPLQERVNWAQVITFDDIVNFSKSLQYDRQFVTLMEP